MAASSYLILTAKMFQIFFSVVFFPQNESSWQFLTPVCHVNNIVRQAAAQTAFRDLTKQNECSAFGKDKHDKLLST